MQFALIAAFHAGLADEICAAIVRGDASFLQLFLIFGIDAADVADDMRSEFTVRILAEQARLDFHAWEAIPIGGKLRYFLVREARTDRQTLGIARLGEQLPEPAAVFGLDVLTYAIFSNHLHVILRTRPDVVETWSDDEAARRWLRLFPLAAAR